MKQHRIRELFEHDTKAGQLIWRPRPVEQFETVRGWKRWNSRYAGSVAGCIDDGYRRIGVDGKMRKAHRLIWICANGDIPAGFQIDHINGIRDDNRLENLRLVTNTENQRNSSIPKNNTSGVVGVSWRKIASKWQASIKIDGRTKYLGLFATIEAAAAARARAGIEFGFHQGHGKPGQSATLGQQESKHD